MTAVSPEIRLQGIPICRGIAIGKLFFFNRTGGKVLEWTLATDQIEQETLRYQQALHLSKQDIEHLQKQLENEGALEAAMILDAQLLMLADPLITDHIEKEIRETKKNAEYVFQSAILTYQKKFNALSDPFFRDRFKDIEDISSRIMEYLHQGGRKSLNDLPEGSIVVSRDLTPSDMAEAKTSSVSGIVTESGGVTSHAAIVAIAKGIPYVTNICFKDINVIENLPAIVDGRRGEVIINPIQKTLEKYEKLKVQLHGQTKSLERLSSLPSETYDGFGIRVHANIEMSHQMEMVHRFGGQGVGLFRSEYIFFPKNEIPSEEKQYLIYRQLVEKMKGMPLVVRAFDLGGDKSLPGYSLPNEGNPFLGCRAIRFLLREKEILKTQLRAVVRAGRDAPVSILFPMVSTLAELQEAKKLVRDTEKELGIPNGQGIRIGCMVEVPSAAMVSDHLAKECDFLSIGTNDLVQYSLAVDRGNQYMADLYDPTNPSILRLIKLITCEGDQQGIPVSVCGEIAADPRFTPLLLGLGVQELSVAPRYIPIIKHAVRNTSIVEAVDLADRALSMTTAQEVLELISSEYHRNVPDDYLYNE